MTPLEAMDLVDLHRARYPHHERNEKTPDLWALLLADVAAGLGRQAAADMMSRGAEPHPAAIRRWVADRCGVGSPPFDGLAEDVPRLLALWADCDSRGDESGRANYMARLVLAGVEPALVEAVGRGMGDLASQVAVHDSPSTVRAQLRNLYNEHRERLPSPVAPGALAGVDAAALGQAREARAELVGALERYEAAMVVFRADPGSAYDEATRTAQPPRFDAAEVAELTARLADVSVRRHALAPAAAGALGAGK